MTGFKQSGVQSAQCTARVSITRVTASAADLRMTIGRHWPLSANVSWRLEDDTWSGDGRVWGSLEELRFDHRVAGPYPALASGSLQPMLPAGPQLDMLVNWERWNFGDQELVDGEVRAAGWLDAYTMEYDLTLEGIAAQQFAVAGIFRRRN